MIYLAGAWVAGIGAAVGGAQGWTALAVGSVTIIIGAALESEDKE